MYQHTIEKEEIKKLQQRMDLLFDCLIICTNSREFSRKPIFTSGERILINQERGAIMSQLSSVLYPDETHDIRYITVPENIEQKIQIIKSKL